MSKLAGRNKYPKVGDVINSLKFVNGYFDKDRDKDRCWWEFPSIIPNLKDGKLIIIDRTKDFRSRGAACDKSRKFANFIVERVSLELAYFGNTWTVIARRLTVDGLYNPSGEVIEFCMRECHEDFIDPKDVRIVRKMQLSFI